MQLSQLHLENTEKVDIKTRYVFFVEKLPGFGQVGSKGDRIRLVP